MKNELTSTFLSLTSRLEGIEKAGSEMNCGRGEGGKRMRAKIHKVVVVTFIALAWLMLRNPKVYCQFTGSGVIQGAVTDPSGAAIPNARVAALNVTTGVNTIRTTTNTGFYVVSPLPPGQYKLTVSANGFRTVVREHVTVNTLSVVELDFSMRVGATNQEITVTGAPPVLTTTNASLGGTVSNQVYNSLPLNMGANLSAPGAQAPRNPEGFIYLLPGVSSGQGFSGGNINGGEMLSKEVYVNGLPFNTAEVQGENRPLEVAVPVDSINEFKVETSGASAQYDGEGVENFVTKSGTNGFHGSAYEYLRNTVFDSRGFFASQTPVEIQNELGGTFGGPIKKDKAFFFGNYDGYRLRLGTLPSFNSIPTTAERNGDFSALPVPIYDPTTTVCTGNVCTRQPFPGNIIPKSMISPASANLSSFLPPTINSSFQNNYLGQYENGQDYNRYSVRGDVNISEKQRLFAWHDQGFQGTIGLPQVVGGTLPLPYAGTRASNNEVNAEQLSDTYIISPRVLNQASLGFIRYAQYFTNFTNGQDYPQKAGITGLPPGATMFPEVDFSGSDSPSSWATPTGAPFYYNSDNWTFQDNAQWIHGSHNVSLGGQIIWREENQNEGSFFSDFGFSNLTTAGYSTTGSILPATGNSFASYLLGDVSSGDATWNSAGVVGQRFRNYAFYAEDDWKATPRLTLDLGLRYQIPTPYYEAFNRGSFFNPTLPNPAAGGYPGIVEFLGYGPDSCQCRTPVLTHYRDFAPRVGLAYKINDKTVFRAGYGIYNLMAGALGGSSQSIDLLGYLANPTFTSPDGGITPAFNWDSGFPSFQPPPTFSTTLNTGFTTALPGGRGAPSAFLDPQLGGKAPYYENWSTAVERELSPSTTVTVAYAGGEGHYLPTGIGRGIYSNEILPKYLALGNLLTAPATSANIAAAQAIFPSITLPYSNFQGSIGQMLLPFPQYSGINDYSEQIGNSTYNSLQVGAERRFSSGLQFLISYTWEKTIDDAGSNLGGFLGASGRTAYNNSLEKAVGVQDIPDTLVTSFVYQLPVGSGHALGSRNPLVRGLVSHWQVSAILTYESGLPLGPVTGSGFAPYTGGTYANYAPGFSGPVRINGSWGSGNVLGQTPPSYINANAFSNPAPLTFGDTPRTLPYDLRNPPLYDEDIAVRREFRIKENLRFQFEADAFNVFNRTVFGSVGTNITSSNFGTVGSQTNTPRQFEFVGKFVF